MRILRNLLAALTLGVPSKAASTDTKRPHLTTELILHTLDTDTDIYQMKTTLLTSRRPERQIRNISNELIRERRRTDEIMQHLPAAAQMSYLAGRADGREEVRQRDHYRRHISWEDGYQTGLTVARDISPAEYMPRNNAYDHRHDNGSRRPPLRADGMLPRPRGPPALLPSPRGNASGSRNYNNTGRIAQGTHPEHWEGYAETVYDSDSEDELTPPGVLEAIGSAIQNDQVTASSTDETRDISCLLHMSKGC
ncbi:MAG: hypothetical protein Q9202_004847 [Teloschistes flavicans]